MTAPHPATVGGRPQTGVCDIPGISQVCDTAGQALSAPFDWLATGLAETAVWMYESVWHLYDTTTLVDVTSPDYLAVYNLTFGIGITLALLLFCCQLITGLLRREPDALRRAALGLARSVLGSFLIITLTAGLLEITDQLCVAIVHATGTTMNDMGGRIAALVLGLTALNLTNPAVGTIVTMFLASLAIAAAATVWFSLLIRKALLLVAIVFAPVALSGQAWDATRAWLPKWASFVLALIISKLVLTVILLVAVTQASAPIDFDLASIADPIAGIVLMFVAAFAPYMAYKFISFAGFDTYHAISSEHEAKDALNRPVPIPSTPRPTDIPRILAGEATTATDNADASPGTPAPADDTDATPSATPEPTPAAGTASPDTSDAPVPQPPSTPDAAGSPDTPGGVPDAQAANASPATGADFDAGMDTNSAPDAGSGEDVSGANPATVPEAASTPLTAEAPAPPRTEDDTEPSRAPEAAEPELPMPLPAALPETPEAPEQREK